MISLIEEVFKQNDLFYIIFAIVAAVLPALFWLWYIYKKDKHEKEPILLLTALVIGGIISAFMAYFLEVLTSFVEALIPDDIMVLLILMTIVSAMLIGIIEESCKYVMMKLISWRSKQFNYTFDGVVYAIYVSLGFALMENILYVFGYGLEVVLPRALLTIPAHMGFGAYMGAYYGEAKIYNVQGNPEKCKAYLKRGLVMAIILHGIYDSLAMLSFSSFFFWLFYIFVALMDLSVFVLIRSRSNNDRNISPWTVI